MVGAPGTSNDRSFTYWMLTTSAAVGAAIPGCGAGVVWDIRLSRVIRRCRRAPAPWWSAARLACRGVRAMLECGASQREWERAGRRLLLAVQARQISCSGTGPVGSHRIVSPLAML